MTDIEKLAKKQKRKEISLKVAEILWLGIGGAIALCGIICLVLGFIINNIGSRTSVNVVRATFNAVSEMMNARSVAQNRGKTLKDMWG